MKLRPEHKDMPVWAKVANKFTKAKKDDDGAISIMAAGMLVFAMSVGTVAVDAGMMISKKRSLQNRADAAAMAAALDPNRAQAIALASIVDNGLGPSNLLAIEDGTWDPSMPLNERFTATSSNSNAIRVTIQDDAPLFFAKYFTGQENVMLQADAVAANVPEAGFSAGTGLASLNGGLLNNLTNQLLGTNVTLDLISYQGLLQTDVSVMRTMKQLALGWGITAGTYKDLLGLEASIGEIVNAMIGVLQGNGNLDANGTAALSALETLAAEVEVGDVTMTLGELLDMGVLAEKGIQETIEETDMDPDVASFHLLFQSMYAARAGSIIDMGLAFTIPGVADLDAEIAYGEPQQSTSDKPQGRIVVGPVGSQVHTAPMRVRINVDLGEVNTPLGYVNVNLPMYFEVAGGDAELTSVTCGSEPSLDSVMTLLGESGAAQLYIGEVSDNAMSNFSNPVTVDEVEIASLLGLIRITASSDAQIVGSGKQSVGFNRNEIKNRTIKTIGNEHALSTTYSSLVGNLTLEAEVLGLLGVSVNAVLNSVANAIGNQTHILDPVVESLLTTLGVKAGYMDLTGLGVRCGAPTLVG